MESTYRSTVGMFGYEHHARAVTTGSRWSLRFGDRCMIGSRITRSSRDIWTARDGGPPAPPSPRVPGDRPRARGGVLVGHGQRHRSDAGGGEIMAETRDWKPASE